MNNRLITLLLLPLCTVFASTATSALARDNQLLILGDSLSAAYGIAIDEGWTNLLDQRLQHLGKNWYVRNVSISGSTTDNGRIMLTKALEQQLPQIVLIELGANDGLRGFPLALIKNNLRWLIQTSKEAGAKVLLAPMELPPNYGDAYITGFRTLYADLSKEQDVTLLPFMLFNIYDTPSLMQDDQLHPTAEAQTIILNNFWKTIEQAIDAFP